MKEKQLSLGNLRLLILFLLSKIRVFSNRQELYNKFGTETSDIKSVWLQGSLQRIAPS